MGSNNSVKGSIAFILCLIMIVFLLSPSFAAEQGNIIIDNSIKGSIEITKSDIDGVTPINGVEFSYIQIADIMQEVGDVSEIKYKLNNDGAEIFKDLLIDKEDTVVTRFAIDEYMKNNTLANIKYPINNREKTVYGKAKFNRLPIGVYLVEETDTKEATIAGESVDIGVSTGAFLLSVPQITPGGTQWEYDLKIRVNNVVNGETITKTVEGEDVGIVADKEGYKNVIAATGSTMWYKLTSNISSLTEDSIYKSFEIGHRDEGNLHYGEKGDSKDTFVNKITVKLGDDILDRSSYTISVDTEDEDTHSFFIKLTDEGLVSLNNKALSASTELVVDYPVYITEDARGGNVPSWGIIKYQHLGAEAGEKEDSIVVQGLEIFIEKMFDAMAVDYLPEGEKVDPYAVKFSMVKKGKNGQEDKPIYVKTITNGEGRSICVADFSVSAEGNGYTREFTCDAYGHVDIVGLSMGRYVITEIETVPGYNLLKKPIDLSLDGKKSYDELLNKSHVLINNDKEPSFELPSVGGMGTFGYTISGTFLMCVAVMLFMSFNRK